MQLLKLCYPNIPPRLILSYLTQHSHPDSCEAGLGEPFLVVTPGGRLL